MPAMKRGSKAMIARFFRDLFGCLRALYTVSRAECPHCFYCGKPATRRDGRDLCDTHFGVSFRAR